jgi:dTDP-4-amino-4,6-dideoxygalactose transaminase
VALAAGVEAVRKSANASTVTVWLPGYFCNEALDPVRRLSANLKYYAMREDLTPDWEKLSEGFCSSAEKQIFVLVHYFGFPNATGEAKAYCDQHGLILFEDSAHMLRLEADVGFGPLMIFSPRKILAVPFGGLLLTSGKLVGLPDAPTGGDDWLGTILWVIRRVTQRVLSALHFPWHLLMNHQEAAADTEAKPLDLNEHWEGCNSYLLRLLTVSARNMEKVVEQRRRNYARLLEWTAGLAQSRPLFPRIPDGVCPYAFPLLVDRGSDDAVQKLQRNGVMASRWPDLPPEVLEAPSQHEVAIRTYEQLLLLPIHQSLSLRQIDIEGQQLRVALGAA